MVDLNYFYMSKSNHKTITTDAILHSLGISSRVNKFSHLSPKELMFEAHLIELKQSNLSKSQRTELLKQFEFIKKLNNIKSLETHEIEMAQKSNIPPQFDYQNMFSILFDVMMIQSAKDKLNLTDENEVKLKTLIDQLDESCEEVHGHFFDKLQKQKDSFTDNDHIDFFTNFIKRQSTLLSEREDKLIEKGYTIESIKAMRKQLKLIAMVNHTLKLKRENSVEHLRNKNE